MSSRPHVVLVHGSRLSASQWSPQLPLLEPHVDVTAVDLPGHGSRAHEPFTLDGCVAAIQDAVVHGGRRSVVVGHSLGGYAAMAHAAEHAAEHAADLSGLLLAGCSAVPTGSGAAVYRGVAALTERIGPEQMTRINNRVLRRVYPAELIEPVIAGGFYFAPTATAWREVMIHCRPAMLSKITCPLLLLNGQFDQFRLGVRRFRRACPQSRVQVLPRASHLTNLDQPRAFAGAVLDFVGSLPAN